MIAGSILLLLGSIFLGISYHYRKDILLIIFLVMVGIIILAIGMILIVSDLL